MHVADSEGHVTVAADSTTTRVEGRDPLFDQDPFSDSATAYPFAGPRLHSLFADERAHTPLRGPRAWPALRRQDFPDEELVPAVHLPDIGSTRRTAP